MKWKKNEIKLFSISHLGPSNKKWSCLLWRHPISSNSKTTIFQILLLEHFFFHQTVIFDWLMFSEFICFFYLKKNKKIRCLVFLKWTRPIEHSSSIFLGFRQHIPIDNVNITSLDEITFNNFEFDNFGFDIFCSIHQRFLATGDASFSRRIGF